MEGGRKRKVWRDKEGEEEKSEGEREKEVWRNCEGERDREKRE